MSRTIPRPRPQALERGRRSCRAVMLAVAEMSVCGVSTRDAERVMAQFGLSSLSSTQVSRAAKLLGVWGCGDPAPHSDDELEAWRGRTPIATSRWAKSAISSWTLATRNHGRAASCVTLPYCRQSKARRPIIHRRRRRGQETLPGRPWRRGSAWTAAAAFSACRWHSPRPKSPITAWGAGFSGGPGQARDAWRAVHHLRRSCRPPKSASGSPARRCWAPPSGRAATSTWRRTPSITHRQRQFEKRIGGQLREIWNAKNLAAAETELKSLADAYRNKAPELAAWLGVAIPEGLAVFTLPEHHRKRMRTANPIERSIQQELKRRTVKVRVFPNNASLLRLVTAVLVEIDETWLASTQPYINWSSPDA